MEDGVMPKAVCRCPCTCGHSHGKASGGTCAWCKATKAKTTKARLPNIPEGLPERWHDSWSVAVEETEKIGVDGVKSWTHEALERIAELEQHAGHTPSTSLQELRDLVNEQAEDESLWGVTIDKLQPITEAYLQQELRRLHTTVEAYLDNPGPSKQTLEDMKGEHERTRQRLITEGLAGPAGWLFDLLLGEADRTINDANLSLETKAIQFGAVMRCVELCRREVADG